MSSWLRDHWKGLFVAIIIFVAVMHDPAGAAGTARHIGSGVGHVADRFGQFFVALTS